MKVKFECPIDFIESNVWLDLGFTEDNNPECLILNPGTDSYYGGEYFEQFKNLKVVGTPSTGVNHLDVNYLKNKGIDFYSLLDDRKSLETITASAEFTWIHIMNSFRGFSNSLKLINNWRDSDNESSLRFRELSGKNIGIIGFGRIGRKVKRYAEAFDMNIKFYDPYIDGGCSSISDLYDSDILSINCYLNDETKNMVSNGFLDGFKDNLIVVNTSRGEVVDEKYVSKLIKDKKIFYSCDVLRNEQDIDSLKTSPLYKLNKKGCSNLVITPHVAGVSVDSQRKALEIILKLCMK